MQAQLKQAIAATRSGKKKEAQILLTQILEADPRNVQAWYLLSLLVDSGSKQRAYLQKVVALDPTHEKAQARLAELEMAETAVPAPSAPPMPPAEEEPIPAPGVETDTADTMPDWLLEEMDTGSVEPDDEEIEPADLPDWLRDSTPAGIISDEAPASEAEIPTPVTAPEPAAEFLPDEEVEEAEQSAAPSARASADAQPAPIASGDKSRTAVERQLTRLNRLLTFLVICAVILFVLLLYTLFTNFLG